MRNLLVILICCFTLLAHSQGKNKTNYPMKDDKTFVYKNPPGPWTKFEENPIYGAQSEMKCFRNKIKFTGYKNSPWVEKGHN